MHMSFWFDYKIEYFLFAGLSTNSITGLLILCVAIIGLAIAFEGLKVLHAEAKNNSVLIHPKGRQKHSSNTGTQDSTTLLGDLSKIRRRKQAACFMLEVCLYVAQVLLGYMLMLSVMTYNGYISLAVMFGVALGYALFGQILLERRIKNAKLSLPCQKCLIQQDQSTRGAGTEGDSTPSGSGFQQTQETVSEIVDFSSAG